MFLADMVKVDGGGGVEKSSLKLCQLPTNLNLKLKLKLSLSKGFLKFFPSWSKRIKVCYILIVCRILFDNGSNMCAIIALQLLIVLH